MKTSPFVAETLWEPADDARERSRLGVYLNWLENSCQKRFADYESLWQWSVTDLAGFWNSVAVFLGVQWHDVPESVLTERVMPGAEWFPGGSLNYAEHLLHHRGTGAAVVTDSQTRPTVNVTWDELADQVARARNGLRALGVGRGDRVAAYLPNVAETIVAFLATASLGAVWSSCSPDFGVRAVIERFTQIQPKILLAVDGYRYGTKSVDRREEVITIAKALPSLQAVVSLAYLGDGIPDTIPWSALQAPEPDPGFDPVPFGHPLAILYSSGTTGMPKAIVHSHGGILLEHLKALAFHGDLGRDDRFFWFTTTGWMMWNFLVSGLAVGATVVCFDGDPAGPDMDTLWSLAARHRVSSFGVSAPFLMACSRAGIHPGRDHDLRRIRTVGSTGAPLPAEGFRWVYDEVGVDLFLSSLSGGTDVCTAVVGGSPLHPVRAGIIACRYLGAAVASYSAGGVPVVGEQGEMVITEPMPSMPIGLYGDDGSRYRATYFDEFPGVWRHGDWITVEVDGSCVITGRSDATLNRGGVRIGTAELYEVAESIDGICDSLAVHLHPKDGAESLVLFVVLDDGSVLSDDIKETLAGAIRSELSPRHVPNDIVAVPGIPRTLSGKKLEVPVKRILEGADPFDVASRGSLVNPETLDFFAALASVPRVRDADG